VKAPTKAAAKPVSKPAAKPAAVLSKSSKSKAPLNAPSKATPKSAATPAKTPPKAPAKAALKAVASPTPASKALPKTAEKPSVNVANKAADKSAKSAKAKKPTGPIVTTIRRGIVRPMMNEDEDGLDRSSLSLLSGPRNVTPYMAKKGEAYMGKTQIEHFRSILATWKRDLMQEVDRTVTHMKDEAANPPDPNDRATLESEFSLELRTRDRERKLIRKIDEALGRIEDGSYGYCLETGEEIGIKRLEARPVATLSIEAQERRERREKQYGDRDDRYR